MFIPKTVFDYGQNNFLKPTNLSNGIFLRDALNVYFATLLTRVSLRIPCKAQYALEIKIYNDYANFLVIIMI